MRITYNSRPRSHVDVAGIREVNAGTKSVVVRKLCVYMRVQRKGGVCELDCLPGERESAGAAPVGSILQQAI